MKARLPLLALSIALLATSCATDKPKVVGWPGSQVFKMPKPSSFMSETLELKDGRFRYWFSSDVILSNSPKYPMEGSYTWRGDELVLSSGKSYKVRQINERRTLFWPHAVDYWDRQQIIPGHILLQVENIDSHEPTRESFFTEEQRETSAARAGQLEKN